MSEEGHSPKGQLLLRTLAMPVLTPMPTAISSAVGSCLSWT